MYTVGDVSLGQSEFEELKLLVEEEARGTMLSQYAMERLDPRRIGEFPDRRLVETYHSLASKGLITGTGQYPAFTFIELNQSGIDWIKGYEQKLIADTERADAERKTERKQRIHDYHVAGFQSFVGAIVGILAERFIGITSAIAKTVEVIQSLLR